MIEKTSAPQCGPITPAFPSHVANTLNTTRCATGREITHTAVVSHVAVNSDKRCRGFSLLELIVVIAMMAVLTAVIVPRLNIGGEKDQIQTESLRLAELMRRASEESIFKTRELGIRFTDGNYQFLKLEGDGRAGKWVAYEDTIFRKRDWPDNFEVEIEVAGVAVELEDAEQFKIDEKTRPHIMFLSNGEVMPDFRVLIDKGILDDRWQVASGVEEPVIVSIAETL